MGTIRVRFILVALVVSFFAVGMAAFLNYFKYKSTIASTVKSRVLLVGRGVENSMQAALQLGMQFGELSQLSQLLARERTADRLIRSIDVIDPTGNVLYSSDPARVNTRAPDDWLAVAEHAKGTEWSTEGRESYVAGISVKNAFNLTIGYVVLRYSREDVLRATATAGGEILVAALATFAAILAISPIALILMIRRFEADLRSLEAAAGHLEDKDADAHRTASSTFDSAIETLRASLSDANRSLDDLRGKLDAAG
jgi:hypothetical protein